MENSNRKRILQAARELFNARGYRSVTTQDMAERAGMSKKTIYRIFSSKEEIAAALVEETMEKVRHVLHLSESSPSDPLSAVKEILIHVKDESMRFGPLFVLDMEKALPDLAEKFNRFRQERNKFVEQLLQTAQDRGLVRDIPVPMAVEVLRTGLKAIVQSHLLPQSRFSLEEKLDLYLDVFCRGIASNPDAP